MNNSIALELLSKILKHKSGDVVDSMFKRGIIYKINYGVPITTIKRLTQPFLHNHELAEELFALDYREAKLAAIYIEDPNLLSAEQMDYWAKDFINDEIVEQAVANLFWKSKHALYKATEWALSTNEYLQKTGLLIIGKYAGIENQIKDSIFEPYLDIIEDIAATPSPHSRSAAAYALREIGKRNKYLNEKAVNLAVKLSESDNFSSKWIAEETFWILKETKFPPHLS